MAGLPRNNQGEETQQTQYVRDFIQKLQAYFAEQEKTRLFVRFQDESLTSVVAETRFGNNISRTDRATGKVDAEAAAIILQDFIETTNIEQLEEEINGAK